MDTANGDMKGEATARDILKLLQIGKTVTVQVATPVEFSNLRSRIATLKSREDEISIGLGLYEEAPTMNTSCRVSDPLHDPTGLLGFDCIFKFSEKKPLRTYSIVSVE